MLQFEAVRFLSYHNWYFSICCTGYLTMLHRLGWSLSWAWSWQTGVLRGIAYKAVANFLSGRGQKSPKFGIWMGYVLGNYPLMGPPFPPYWTHLTSKSCFPLPWPKRWATLCKIRIKLLTFSNYRKHVLFTSNTFHLIFLRFVTAKYTQQKLDRVLFIIYLSSLE